MFSRFRQIFPWSVHARWFALAALVVFAKGSEGCASSEEESPGCGKDCSEACKADFARGAPGSYTSLAKASDGTLWVAGYNDGLLDEGDRLLWGDLVVGKYDETANQIDWQTVDGLPTRAEGTCAERSSSSWRNGESGSGDNVGLYTSIQVSPSGQPMVAYYDATNKRLKFAVNDDGWKTFTVKELSGSDIGRFAKMLLVDGKPVIAFLQIDAGANGATRSSIVVARSNVAVPTSSEDFRFGEIAIEDTNPCTSTSCASSDACVHSTGICTAKVGGCTPADCGQDKACVLIAEKPTCVATRGAIQTYPDVFGNFIAFAKGPERLGIAVYDRPHGNLVALAEQGDGTWKRTIVDGEKGLRADKSAVDTGDVGIAPSLQIDVGGTWHLSYVNALDETLRYITIAGDVIREPVIVDDATGVDGVPFSDGKHLVGDDSAIRVDGDTVTIYYQDATAGTLRRALGKTDGKSGTWELRALPQPNKFGGFFPQIVPGDNRVTNFWEQTDIAGKSRSGDVSFVTP